MTGAGASVEHAIALALGAPIRILERTPLGGGSINDTVRLDTSAGVFVVKSHRRAPARMFQAEAEGLDALRASGTTLVIPRVIALGSDAADASSFIVLEYLPAGRRRGDFDEALGRGLAEVHRATADRFGFGSDNYCGATPQPNPWTDRWVDFYAESRLGHQLRLAIDAGLVSGPDRQRVESLISRLGDWLDEPPSGPSLVHGDLWSGNLHADQGGRPALLDPPGACFPKAEPVPMSVGQREAMAALGIVAVGSSYCWKTYRYDRLDDAVAYAELMRSRGE